MSDLQFLRPCPFCGGSHLNHDREQGAFHVWCLSCGAAMIGKPTSNAAIEAWNRREKPDNAQKTAVCPSCASPLIAVAERPKKPSGVAYSHYCQSCKSRVG